MRHAGEEGRKHVAVYSTMNGPEHDHLHSHLILIIAHVFPRSAASLVTLHSFYSSPLLANIDRSLLTTSAAFPSGREPRRIEGPEIHGPGGTLQNELRHRLAASWRPGDPPAVVSGVYVRAGPSAYLSHVRQCVRRAGSHTFRKRCVYMHSKNLEFHKSYAYVMHCIPSNGKTG